MRFHYVQRLVRTLAVGSMAASCSATSADISGFEITSDASAPLPDVPVLVSPDAPLPDVGTPVTTLFYSNTNESLFSADPGDIKGTLRKMGEFDCVGTGDGQVVALTDIAVSKEGRLYGVTNDRIFLDMRIDGTTIECKSRGVKLSSSGSFYGASFAPAGTVDASSETLIIADSNGDLYAVDTTSGAIRKAGHFGNVPSNDGNGHTYDNRGKRWELSGDIVFLENAGKPVGFATVRDCPDPPKTAGCNRTDTLIQLDPMKLSTTSPGNVTTSVRGQIVRAPGCSDSKNSSYGSIFGIAAHQGQVYGFAKLRDEDTGKDRSLLVRIDNTNGAACLEQDVSVLAPGGWAGAGITTQAPVIAPPPK